MTRYEPCPSFCSWKTKKVSEKEETRFSGNTLVNSIISTVRADHTRVKGCVIKNIYNGDLKKVQEVLMISCYFRKGLSSLVVRRASWSKNKWSSSLFLFKYKVENFLTALLLSCFLVVQNNKVMLQMKTFKLLSLLKGCVTLSRRT